ncbi:MAG: DUF1491 family protein [Rhizobiaceae bacterium]
MRVTSEIWVSALVRRVFSMGGFAAIVQRGSPEAGAIYITTRNRLGEVELYAPAPQTSYDTSKPEERLFSRIVGLDNEAIDARLAKERRFDPDVWIVELEVADGVIDEMISIEERQV